MADNIQIVNKEEFERFFRDFKVKQEKQGNTQVEFVKSLGNNEYLKTYKFGEKAQLNILRSYVKETVSAEVNGLQFVFQIPMYKNEFWSSDSQTHKAFYEKEM